ncbi:penicillin-binding protein [Streptomyces sp. Ru73]|uniref:serine hydrolase domain-containing protein n=1 Tax=Streptomyces sp. Ru73 TaxID=2080748 RepID=UPI000CDD5CD3|nr:serine hydrolase domain-containing protein [Streptomyces sp. Ru73]POX42396.1 penicillin-binding protein [Streptomyces sp. Ru73]
MPGATSCVTRRTLLRAATVSAATAAAVPVLGPSTPATPAPPRPRPAAAPGRTDPLFRELDKKIRAGMAAYGIPGAAVGVLYRGTEYVKGYGVTNVDYPVPVDGDTVFRIGSTTKTFTGTTVMRLVEGGRLALDAPVRRYLPEFRTAEPSVASRVTLRQVLNHTAGWLGDDYQDTGAGDDAAAQYVAGMVRLPQLSPPGAVFAYNNAAVELAGRVVERVTGGPYESAVRDLLIDPLGMTHSRYFVNEVIGLNVAASHRVADGKPVVAPSDFALPRSLAAAGGLISSARDQLRWARFHLGDGTVPGSRTRLLTRRSLVAMRAHPGPGGTLYVEIDGVGVTWMLRPSAQGVRIVQHGGDTPGQHSGFLLVPDRGFAFTLLTNSEGGARLVLDLFADDWALRRFAGLSNLPARPHALSRRELARYEGRYTRQEVDEAGQLVTLEQEEVFAEKGGLVATVEAKPVGRLAFYRPDHALALTPDGEDTHTRVDFVRGAGGRVEWLRSGGRLSRREMAGK